MTTLVSCNSPHKVGRIGSNTVPNVLIERHGHIHICTTAVHGGSGNSVAVLMVLVVNNDFVWGSERWRSGGGVDHERQPRTITLAVPVF